MQRIKRIFYPIKTIVIPFVIMITLSIILSSIFKIIDFESNGFLIEFSKLKFNHPRRVSCIFLFLVLWVVYVKYNRSKNKEFAPSDIYGDYPIVIYYLAWLFSGYKKVNLKMKPIPLQFQLLNVNKLECFDDTEYQDKIYKYKVDHVGKLNQETSQINIIISDTYQIASDKIPKELVGNYTIILARIGDKGIRVKSSKLIELLIKEIQSTKQYCKNYNLFLATPASTNMSIFNQVFHTVRDKFIINVYQQDNKNNFKFKNKPIKIKC